MQFRPLTALGPRDSRKSKQHLTVDQQNFTLNSRLLGMILGNIGSLDICRAD